MANSIFYLWFFHRITSRYREHHYFDSNGPEWSEVEWSSRAWSFTQNYISKTTEHGIRTLRTIRYLASSSIVAVCCWYSLKLWKSVLHTPSVIKFYRSNRTVLMQCDVWNGYVSIKMKVRYAVGVPDFILNFNILI